jgi:hypothetical protein
MINNDAIVFPLPGLLSVMCVHPSERALLKASIKQEHSQFLHLHNTGYAPDQTINISTHGHVQRRHMRTKVQSMRRKNEWQHEHARRAEQPKRETVPGSGAPRQHTTSRNPTHRGRSVPTASAAGITATGVDAPQDAPVVQAQP